MITPELGVVGRGGSEVSRSDPRVFPSVNEKRSLSGLGRRLKQQKEKYMKWIFFKRVKMTRNTWIMFLVTFA
jgi:hypothetical protein